MDRKDHDTQPGRLRALDGDETRRASPTVRGYLFRLPNGNVSATPIVLSERQAGVAMEGVLRQQPLEITQLAVDTHGYTDMEMALSRTAGFDLCPRLKALNERRLFLPRGIFRRKLLRVLNRGEATNALKRVIYTGRVSNYQVKREDEMQAVADALSLNLGWRGRKPLESDDTRNLR